MTVTPETATRLFVATRDVFNNLVDSAQWGLYLCEEIEEAVTVTPETATRLLVAAQDVFNNLVDSAQWGPDDNDVEEHSDFPVDEDGDCWWPDVWELGEAINAARFELRGDT